MTRKTRQTERQTDRRTKNTIRQTDTQTQILNEVENYTLGGRSLKRENEGGEEEGREEVTKRGKDKNWMIGKILDRKKETDA